MLTAYRHAERTKPLTVPVFDDFLRGCLAPIAASRRSKIIPISLAFLLANSRYAGFQT